MTRLDKTLLNPRWWLLLPLTPGMAGLALILLLVRWVSNTVEIAALAVYYRIDLPLSRLYSRLFRWMRAGARGAAK